VVFNHTAEGNERGPTISFRGLDNKTYYMLTPEGYYFNFSGTGNTLNCNNPIVRSMVLDCLRYWAAEYHIDGFRFDLAAILGRDQNGAPLLNPPLLETLAFDPVLAKCKLIAEAWDAGGLYQVGSFPAYGRWAEWNGKYRDAVRKFLKGDAGMVARWRSASRARRTSTVGARARPPRSTSSPATTGSRCATWSRTTTSTTRPTARTTTTAPTTTQLELRLGGPTDDPAINALRERQMKNALAILLTSQGVPMLLMGDEMGRTQHGNNNTYCHDSELNWLDWACSELRRPAPVHQPHHRLPQGAPGAAQPWHLRNTDYVGSGYPTSAGTASAPGTRTGAPAAARSRSCCAASHGRGGRVTDDYIYVAMNMHWDASACRSRYARRWR
jgi:isoamylase